METLRLRNCVFSTLRKYRQNFAHICNGCAATVRSGLRRNKLLFYLGIKVLEFRGHLIRHKNQGGWCPVYSFQFVVPCVGPLCFIKSKASAAIDQKTLEYLCFLLLTSFGEIIFIFQHDLATAHTSNVINTWFNDHHCS